jgi:hypothetical protein
MDQEIARPVTSVTQLALFQLGYRCLVVGLEVERTLREARDDADCRALTCN